MSRALEYVKDRPAYAAQPRTVVVYLFVKRALLRLCKLLGLFRLSIRLTSRGCRILCYHGFSLADESAFSKRTFIDPGTFEKRMAFLKRNGFRVLGLVEALDLLDADAVPPKATVITIDDGFPSVRTVAWPILQKYGFPATIYVSTYYAVKENPVFNLAIQYLFWKTKKTELDVTGIGIARSGVVSLGAEDEKTALLWEIVRHGDDDCDEEGRVRLSRAIGERLGVDYEGIAKSRMLGVMTLDEIKELAASGADIQLHTHRHEFPRVRERAVREIRENRAVLEPLVGKTLEHFCYPSGFWAEDQWPWLAETHMRSAVTCESGLNYRDTPRYGLKRIGDDEGLSPIELEAQICGFYEMLRGLIKSR